MPALRRREFITLLGGAAVVWPIAARGQQTGAMRRVAFLHGLAESDPEVQARIAAFREGLEFLGWVQDRNIRIEHRFASGDIARIRQYVAELVNSPPDVIAATGTPVLAALKEATRSIPIVFSVVNDPAGQGFVANLARPGGNITGFSYIDFPMIGKWLEIMKEVIPGVRRITLMFNPETAPSQCSWESSEQPPHHYRRRCQSRQCAMRRRSTRPYPHLGASQGAV
jgi:putative ABC transport system substrate-binding protein